MSCCVCLHMGQQSMYARTYDQGMYAWEDVHVPAHRSPSSKGTTWGGQGFRPNSAPCAPTQEGPEWLHMRDFDRLLRESQREVLRLQRQIALRNQQESSPPLRPPGRTVRVRARAPTSRAPGEVSAGTGAGVWVCVEGGGGSRISS